MIAIVPVSVDGGYRWRAVTEDGGGVIAVQPDFGDGGLPLNTETEAVRFGKLWIRGALGAPVRLVDFSVVHNPGFKHTTRCCGKEVVLKDFPMVGSSGGHTTYRWVCPLCEGEDGVFTARESAEGVINEFILMVATVATEDPKLTFNIANYTINAIIDKVKGSEPRLSPENRLSLSRAKRRMLQRKRWCRRCARIRRQ